MDRESHHPDSDDVPWKAVLSLWGGRQLLQIQVGQLPYAGLVCHLYVNSLDLQRRMALSDFVECSLSGYSAMTLIPSKWEVLKDPDERTLYYPTFTFTLGAYAGPSVSIYGFYITNSTLNLWYWAEDFPDPVPVPSLGSFLPLAIFWNDKNWRH